MNETRTELGYAWWKEDPKAVKDARDVAKMVIAQRRLARAVTDALTPLLDGITRFLVPRPALRAEVDLEARIAAERRLAFKRVAAVRPDLVAAAEAEASETPHLSMCARNRLAIEVEMAMPPINDPRWRDTRRGA